MWNVAAEQFLGQDGSLGRFVAPVAEYEQS